MYSRKHYFVTATLLVFLLAACEGPKDFNVLVVNKKTLKPVENVYVQIKVKKGKSKYGNYDMAGYTDSLGNFKSSEMVGYGISVRKVDFYMEYSKKGFISKTEKNKTEGVVELEPMR